MSVASVQLIIIDHKKPVPEFTSDKLKVFFNLLSIERYFCKNLLNSNHFFLVQKCERQLLSGLC